MDTVGNILKNRQVFTVQRGQSVLEAAQFMAAKSFGAVAVLDGDRLVGKLDATADRKAGMLRVDAVHEDEPLDRAARDDVQQAIEGLAEWLGLGVERTGRSGAGRV